MQRRTNSEGIIDLTKGGPLSYEEIWELKESEGSHSLRDYFFDDARVDKYNRSQYPLPMSFDHLLYKPEYRQFPIESKLAKVYFIDDFEGFVNYNGDFCLDIIKEIERCTKKSEEERIKAKQDLYL